MNRRLAPHRIAPRRFTQHRFTLSHFTSSRFFRYLGALHRAVPTLLVLGSILLLVMLLLLVTLAYAQTAEGTATPAADRAHAASDSFASSADRARAAADSLPPSVQTARDSLPPAAALVWQDPGTGDLLNEIARLETAVSPWGQVDYSVRIDPVFRYRYYPAEADPGEWTGRLGMSATLGFSDPPDTHARALQRLARARRALGLLRLDGVADALLAHADLLLAQQRERTARQELEEAEEELAAARRDVEEDEEVVAADLELRMAKLDHRDSLLDLDEAQIRALAHGLSATAHYQPLRFSLAGAASADYRDTFEYRLLELELQEAEAELALARRAPLDDLRVGAAYRTPGAQLDLEGGLVNGSPRATAGLDLPGGVQRWQVQLSAQFVMDEGWRELPQLKAAVAAARMELQSYPQLFRTALASALERAMLAEEALDLAEEDLALHGEPARTRLYRTWTAYIRAIAEVLETSGASWTERANSSGR